MAGSLADIRAEMLRTWREREGVQAVRFGYPPLGEPFHLHFGLDWGSTTTRDTMTSNRVYGFYARYFLPAPDVEEADLLFGAFFESVLDFYDTAASKRMADGTNFEVRLRNRGGPPIRMGGERKVVRKDFYVECEAAKPRVP